MILLYTHGWWWSEALGLVSMVLMFAALNRECASNFSGLRRIMGPRWFHWFRRRWMHPFVFLVVFFDLCLIAGIMLHIIWSNWNRL